MNEWGQNNKKRRDQQVRMIKEGSPTSIASRSGIETIPWSQGIQRIHEGNVQRGSGKTPWQKKLLIQAIISSMLFVVVAILVNTHTSALNPAEKWVAQVMSRDFNFAGLERLYKQYAGEAPAILPTFLHNSPAVKVTAHPAKAALWKAPATGDIFLPYEEQRKGLVLRTATHAEVTTPAEGWVIFVGNQVGLGNTVVIQHANGVETWYGWLQDVKVKEKGWVKGGQLLGFVNQTQGQSLLYLAVKKNNKFIDPTSVMDFE